MWRNAGGTQENCGAPNKNYGSERSDREQLDAKSVKKYRSVVAR